MSQTQTQLAVALARVAARDGKGVRAAGAGDSETSDKDEEAETCALHLVWANRYDVEIRRLRSEIRRQKYLLKLMNAEMSSESTSGFVSLVEYEQRMQEGCAYDCPFDADGVRSSEASTGRDDPPRSRVSSGSCVEELHGSFPSMDSGVFLPFDAGEGQGEASSSSLLDQLEDLMSHPQEELTESVEDGLLQECLYSSSESLAESGEMASTCNSVRSSDECEVTCKIATVSCSEFCATDSPPTCRKGSLLDSLHNEEIQCRRTCGESTSVDENCSVKSLLHENCSVKSLLDENCTVKSLLDENCSVKSLLEENRLNDTGAQENPGKNSSSVNRLEESDGAKTSDETSVKSHVLESEFGWSLVEEDHPEGSGSKETVGNSCSKETVGNSCSKETVGNSCSKEAVENSCSKETAGNSCSKETGGNSCSKETGGNSCSKETGGNSCSKETGGNSCSKETGGNSCSKETVGNSCSKESGGNSPAELQRSYSEEDHLEAASEEENECDSSFAESISLEENQSAKPASGKENRVEVPDADDNQEPVKKPIAGSIAAEILSASRQRKPSAEANQHDAAENDGNPDDPEGKFSGLQHRAQSVRNGVAGISRLSLESMVDFVSLDNQVSSLLRSVRDTFRQSKIVVALESLCNILEQRLEEEWWAAYDLHLAPSERNYIV